MTRLDAELVFEAVVLDPPTNISLPDPSFVRLVLPTDADMVDIVEVGTLPNWEWEQYFFFIFKFGGYVVADHEPLCRWDVITVNADPGNPLAQRPTVRTEMSQSTMVWVGRLVTRKRV
jgi:hypothetical protein